jgi:hypothetical protein
MALSMEEQRILDAMERKLADDDPKLASRLTSFGQPRIPGSGKARAVVVLVSLALAAVVTLMIYQMRPANGGTGRTGHPQQARVFTSPRSHQASHVPATASAVPNP